MHRSTLFSIQSLNSSSSQTFSFPTAKPPMIPDQLLALGVTPELMQRYRHGFAFTPNYNNALINLMTDREEGNRSPEDALVEISGLNYFELYGICNGFDRGDVMGLPRAQIFLMCDFEDMTPDLLCEYRHEHAESPYYLEAVIRLMRGLVDFDRSAAQALEEIEGLNEVQLYGIAKGLSRDDVVYLYSYQIEAMIHLKDSGLTVELLQRYPSPHIVTPLFPQALFNLMKKGGATAEQALYEIAQCDIQKLEQIALGVSTERSHKNRRRV